MGVVWMCEVYAECLRRDAERAQAFLSAFGPEWSEAAGEYLLPRQVFHDAGALIASLEVERSEAHAVYWNRIGSGEPHQAMLFFTRDGGMIAGLAARGLEPGSLLQRLVERVGGEFGVAVFEEPPPDTSSAFRSLCRGSSTARMVDGRYFGAEEGFDLKFP